MVWSEVIFLKQSRVMVAFRARSSECKKPLAAHQGRWEKGHHFGTRLAFDGGGEVNAVQQLRVRVADFLA